MERIANAMRAHIESQYVHTDARSAHTRLGCGLTARLCKSHSVSSCGLNSKNTRRRDTATVPVAVLN